MLQLVVDAERDEVEFRHFVEAIDAQLQGVRDVEEALKALEHVRVKIYWTIHNLSANGQLKVELNPTIRAASNELRPDFGSEVTRHYVEQIRYLRAEHGVPPYLSIPTVERLGKVTHDLQEHNVRSVKAIDQTSGREVDFDEDTQQALSDLVTPAWQASGSISGKLQTIGRRPRPYANVYEDVRGRAIRCEFDEHMQDQVLAAFNQRVIAQGLLSYNSQNQVTRLRLTELEVLPEDDELPRDLYGRYPRIAPASDALFGGNGSWQATSQ